MRYNRINTNRFTLYAIFSIDYYFSLYCHASLSSCNTAEHQKIFFSSSFHFNILRTLAACAIVAGTPSACAASAKNHQLALPPQGKPLVALPWQENLVRALWHPEISRPTMAQQNKLFRIAE
jgi:hypothetical protein